MADSIQTKSICSCQSVGRLLLPAFAVFVAASCLRVVPEPTPAVVEAPFRLTVEKGDAIGDVRVLFEGAPGDAFDFPGEYRWLRNGLEQERVAVESPYQIVAANYTFTPFDGENTITFLYESEGGDEVIHRVRIAGRDVTSQPPVIDGDVAEWLTHDPNPIRIFASKHGYDQPPTPPDELFGMVRSMWDDQYLYVTANVEDATPLFALSADQIHEYDAVSISVGEPGGLLYTVTLAPAGDTGAVFSLLETIDGTIDSEIVAAGKRTEKGYLIEAAIPARDLGVTPQVGDLLHWNMQLLDQRGIGERLSLYIPVTWSAYREAMDRDPAETEYAWSLITPDPVNRARSSRSQHTGENQGMRISEVATLDPLFKSPLPATHENNAALLPDWLTLRLPFNGTHTIKTGYGFQSSSWTHQTIGNDATANDFYCIDIDMPIGTPILATAPGTIVTSNRRGDSYGNYVVIDHGGGYTSIYAHNDELLYYVDKAEPRIEVQSGDLISRSGKSGTSWPHLHFGLHKNSRISHSGADVGGQAVLPEPLGGYYGLREGQSLTATE